MTVACGPAGRVVACEPNPILTETYLPQNLALNGFYHGVEICPKVIGNLDDQTVDFVLHDSDFATSSLERWAYAHRSGSVQVPAVTLDRLCADWPRLDLVKIDAEGADKKRGQVRFSLTTAGVTLLWAAWQESTAHALGSESSLRRRLPPSENLT